MQVGILAKSRLALRYCAAWETSPASGSSSPMKETAVRIMSIGWALAGKLLITRCSVGLISRSDAVSSWKAASWLRVGSSPSQSR